MVMGGKEPVRYDLCALLDRLLSLYSYLILFFIFLSSVFFDLLVAHRKAQKSYLWVTIGLTFRFITDRKAIS